MDERWILFVSLQQRLDLVLALRCCYRGSLGFSVARCCLLCLFFLLPTFTFSSLQAHMWMRCPHRLSHGLVDDISQVYSPLPLSILLLRSDLGFFFFVIVSLFPTEFSVVIVPLVPYTTSSYPIVPLSLLLFRYRYVAQE